MSKFHHFLESLRKSQFGAAFQALKHQITFNPAEKCENGFPNSPWIRSRSMIWEIVKKEWKSLNCSAAAEPGRLLTPFEQQNVEMQKSALHLEGKFLCQMECKWWFSEICKTFIPDLCFKAKNVACHWLCMKSVQMTSKSTKKSCTRRKKWSALQKCVPSKPML